MLRLMMDRAYFARASAIKRTAICADEKQFRDYIGTVRREDVTGRFNTVARLKIDAPIMFEPTGWDMFMCLPTDRVATAIREAAEDPDVDIIVLELDCPGGTVSGWDDISAAIKAAREVKPVKALVHDGAYSLGMRMACMCDEIVATPTAAVGSIGTIVMLYDDAAMYAEAGVIAKPVGSDEFKAVGHGGVPVSDEYIAHIRTEIVEPDYAEFVSEVAVARGLTDATVRGLRSLIYPARKALALKLVDRIENADAYVAELAAALPQQDPRPALGDGNGSEGAGMNLAQLKEKHPDLVKQIEEGAVAGAAAELAAEAAKPATFAQLKAEFGADSAFVVNALDQGLTLSAARKAWSDKTSAERAALEARLKEADTKLAQIATLPGRGQAEAITTGGNAAAPGASDYEALVKAKVASGMNVNAAHVAVQKENPAAHKAYAAKLAQGCTFK
jgi:signal peptide peptidase SppA